MATQFLGNLDLLLGPAPPFVNFTAEQVNVAQVPVGQCHSERVSYLVSERASLIAAVNRLIRVATEPK